MCGLSFASTSFVKIVKTWENTTCLKLSMAGNQVEIGVREWGMQVS